MIKRTNKNFASFNNYSSSKLWVDRKLANTQFMLVLLFDTPYRYSSFIVLSMRFIPILFFTFFTLATNGQAKQPNALLAIDHVPIVVKDMDSIKKLFSNTLHFTIKNGREHEGIKNCFIKFQDGTYLELVTPTDSLQATGKFYTAFLKKRAGGTALAVSVNSVDTVMKKLMAQSIIFESSNTNFWKTVSPKDDDIFFIEYADKRWKDSKLNTTHSNLAYSLRSIFLLSDSIILDIKKYTSFGFTKKESGYYQGIPYSRMQAGNSNLYLLNAANKNSTGICGFEIKTASLKQLNSLLPKTANVLMEKNKTIIHIPELNLFLTFTE